MREENRFKKDSSPFKALLHGGVSFVKNYLLKRGFAYGADGLTISVSNAQGSYYKYVKLYERNRTITVSSSSLPTTVPMLWSWC